MAAPRATAAVDAYLAKAPAFAKPILTRLRKLVHEACPECSETIKWGRPFFLYRASLLGNMSAFTQHCSFGFWGAEMGAVLKAAGVDSEESSGSFGRLTTLTDLPSDKAFLGYVRQAMKLIDDGARTVNKVRVAKTKAPTKPKPPPPMPPELAKALKANKRAAAAFEGFSPSHRREYIEWIGEAKREATRESRVATAMVWLAEGKARNWKYEKR